MYTFPTPSTTHPTLVHLNADTSWLLHIPLPAPSSSGKSHYTILIDPWLSGPQSDYFTWFSTQWHVVQSCVERVEELAPFDAVVISHEFADHCHKPTLLEVDPATPVYATAKAADLIRSYNHFTSVHTIPALPKDTPFPVPPLPGLPDSISITRLVSEQRDLLYYHSAVCIAYKLASPSVDSSEKPPLSADLPPPEAECILYTPHGLPSHSLSLPPTLRVSALLHGLHEVTNPSWLGGTMNLGGRNAVRAARKTGARWWIGTHDEVKRGGGFVAMVMRRRVWSVEEALEAEKEGGGELRHVVLGSGESLVIE